ncbi:hypothetical protein INR49_021986 [Caranx melampygus]|nr:hypothetical protein INR49_021986 [Caranx melampygus]
MFVIVLKQLLQLLWARTVVSVCSKTSRASSYEHFSSRHSLFRSPICSSSNQPELYLRVRTRTPWARSGSRKTGQREREREEADGPVWFWSWTLDRSQPVDLICSIQPRKLLTLGPAAVALAGVLSTGPVPGTQHVPGDVELGVEATLLQGHPGQHQALQVPGGGPCWARRPQPDTVEWRTVASVLIKVALAAGRQMGTTWSPSLTGRWSLSSARSLSELDLL